MAERGDAGGAEDAVHRPFERRRELGGGYRPEVRLDARDFEDRGGEFVPATAAARRQVDCASDAIADRREKRFRDLGGVGGGCDLVRHDADRVALARKAKHRFDEVAALARRTGDSVQPGNAHDQRVRIRLPHHVFRGDFGAAIDVHAAAGVVLQVGCALRPVEDVVGADLDDGGRAGPCRPSDVPAAQDVHAEAGFGVCFGLREVVEGGGVEDKVGIDPRDQAPGRCAVGHIGIGARCGDERDRRVSPEADDVRPQLAAGAEQEDAHRRILPALLVCVGGLEDGRAGNRRHRRGRLLDGELSVRRCGHRRR